MGWIEGELALVAVAAMLSPTTLSFSVLALVLADRPLRTGLWFYLGALTATLAVGVVAGFVLGDAAASNTSSPKTSVAVLDVIASVFLIVFVVRFLRRPRDPKRVDTMVAQISKVASSSAVIVIGAGAVLANPGGFIPLALKNISETNPSTTQYIVEWILFSLVSLLPLSAAIACLLVSERWTLAVLWRTRDWLIGNARVVAAVILLVLAASLLRNGIAGLVTS